MSHVHYEPEGPIEERSRAVSEAVRDEERRFNAKVAAFRLSGRPLRCDEEDSLTLGREIQSCWGFCLTTGTPPITQTWAYANDGRWARLLWRVNEPRHPLFAEFEYTPRAQERRHGT